MIQEMKCSQSRAGSLWTKRRWLRRDGFCAAISLRSSPTEVGGKTFRGKQGCAPRLAVCIPLLEAVFCRGGHISLLMVTSGLRQSRHWCDPRWSAAWFEVWQEDRALHWMLSDLQSCFACSHRQICHQPQSRPGQKAKANIVWGPHPSIINIYLSPDANVLHRPGFSPLCSQLL